MWKKKYAHLGVSELRRVRQLEDENGRLKRVVADLTLDKPQADFIVGNPPYLGNKRMRVALGDGYVEALRAAYPEVPSGADLVMYWWSRSAISVADGATLRSGLITTNSIVQPLNRKLIVLARDLGAHVIWAVADHPWTSETDGAAVRVALTVVSRSGEPQVLRGDREGAVSSAQRASVLNDDLSSGVDVVRVSAAELIANSGISHQGVSPQASGFVLGQDEAAQLMKADSAEVVFPYLNGRDLVQRARGRFIIDFGLRTQAEARQFAHAYQIVEDRVKPDRASNKRRSYRELWWRFGEPRKGMRDALAGLGSFIGTAYVAAHRTFQRIDIDVVPDDKIVVIALESAFYLGVLSSSIHQTWAAAAGTRLGMGNDLTYNSTRCFDSFPFAAPAESMTSAVAAITDLLDAHRRHALARDERVTVTAMYNVVAKLRAGEPLTAKERPIHETAACGVLKDLHDELDALVAEAYGWPWPMEREEILERLVALHDDRVAEEKAGHIRWLRPDYQITRFAPETAPAELALPESKRVVPTAAVLPKPTPWPSQSVEQLGAVKAVASRVGKDPKAVLGAFTGADERLLRRHLETLSMMGELV